MIIISAFHHFPLSDLNGRGEAGERGLGLHRGVDAYRGRCILSIHTI